MAYPPQHSSSPGPDQDAHNPLLTSTLPPSHVNDDDQAELDLVKRYEDFSTVDWIQDSLRERAPSSYRSPRFLDRFADNDGFVGKVFRALRHVLQEGEAYVVITLVGIVIGVSAALMAIITGWLSDIKLGYCSNGWWLSRKFCCIQISEDGGCDEWHDWPLGYFAYVLYAALFAFSAAYLVRHFAPYAAGSGISEIKCILSGFIIRGFLSFETTVIKALTMPLSIGSGMAIGKEGPSVHVACGAGNVVARMFPSYRRSQLKLREIVTAASAAGVAVAFGSPIGGVLFSIEEMNQAFSTRTMWRSFVCALVATFTLSSMDPFRTGKLVLFQVSYDRDWHYFEIPGFILIGVFGGCYGAFVSKYYLQVAAFRRKHLAKHGVAEAVILATLTGIVGYLNRFMRDDMTEMMSILFRECEGGGDRDGLCQASRQWSMAWSLLLAAVLRTGFVVISYGSKVPAGIFVPSMAVGACFGRFVGILVKALQQSFPNAPWFAAGCAPDAPCITPGTYAFLGAGAALGGITGLTVTVVVIMFELTGALTYLIPVMVVVLVTKAVGEQVGKGGIADQMIRFNGFPYVEKEDAEPGDKSFIEPISHIMKRDLVVLPSAGLPVGSMSEIVQDSNWQGFPVVRNDEDRTIIGFISKTDLRYAFERAQRNYNISPTAICTFQESIDLETSSRGLREVVIYPVDGTPVTRLDFGQYVDETPLTVSPKMPLEIVLQLFRRMGPRVILVSQEGQLVGLVTVKDVLRHEASEKHRQAAAEARASASVPTHGHRAMDSWDAQWESMPDDADGADGTGQGTGGGLSLPRQSIDHHPQQSLEALLEGGYTWARANGVGAVNSVIARVRAGPPAWSGRNAPAGDTSHNDQYSFEMREGDNEAEPERRD